MQANPRGLALKSNAPSGTIMTRAYMKTDFFESYHLELRNAADQARAEKPEHQADTFVEFCLPFAELKHIVDGIVDEGNQIHFEYPVGDAML